MQPQQPVEEQPPQVLATAAGAAAVQEAGVRPGGKKGKGPTPVVVVEDDMLETTTEHR
jgi:hypothetical protein